MANEIQSDLLMTTSDLTFPREQALLRGSFSCSLLLMGKAVVATDALASAPLDEQEV
jgi:hypothetical protein